MYKYTVIYNNNKKVIHNQPPLILKEIKLYTGLSTLSTIMNYSCLMDRIMSISKIRFVTNYKTTGFYIGF